eukprot:evm.model.scf_1036.7 EVM.evm.TU.scf_1036.7   scf_1036:44159-46661(-)
MRAVLQRVKSASVEVDGAVVSQIGAGVLCFVGITKSDTAKELEYICRKILNTRLWPDDEKGKAWDQNVQQIGGEVLLVSQFTLYGRLNGNKLDFSRAMSPQPARDFYDNFVEQMKRAYVPERVKDGIFGAMMNVALVNDGPVTLIIDTNKDTDS